MNSTNLHTLPIAPPVSRAMFFTQLLIEPRPQSEMFFDDPTTDSPAEPTAPIAAPTQPSTCGFSA